MIVQKFNERQQVLQIQGLHVNICRNEREVSEGENIKYEYDVEEFDINNEEDIDKEVEAHMLFLLHEYDKSDKVNCFYLNNKPFWLDKATRVGLKLRFEAEKTLPYKTDTSLWMNGVLIPIKIEKGLEMLYQLEIYASLCYDVTSFHEMNIKSFKDVYKKASYDFTVGYPEKLSL